MKIKITASHPANGEKSIEHLIGREYEIKDKDEAGFYIQYGPGDSYLIKENECEVVDDGWNVIHPGPEQI